MPQYRYRAQTRDGKKVSGVMSASDTVELQQKLKEKKLYYLSASTKSSNRRTRPFKSLVLSDFSRQMGTLSGAGVSLVRALNIIASQESLKKREKAVYEDLLKQIRQGISLSDAMEAQNGAFPSLMVYMYRSAESSGNLDEVAMKMAELYEKEHRMEAKISSSLAYPKFLAGMIVAVILVITNIVFPKMGRLLSEMETMPRSTAILMKISSFTSAYWYLVILSIIGLVLFWRWLMSITIIRRFWHKQLLHLPLIGKHQKTICTARFARTLSSLYAAGIPLVPALQIARKTTGNIYFDAQFDQVISFVRAGNSLSEGLGMVDGMVRKLPDSVMVGEETGCLDRMLVASADAMEYDADIAVAKIVSYINPILMIVMGIVVAFVLLAVFNALYGSYDAIADMAG